MLFKNITVFLLYTINSVLCAKYHLPNEFRKCHLTDHNLDECLNNAIQNAIQQIGSKGIPSLKLHSVDPMLVKEFIVQGDSYNHHYSDVKIIGFSKANVRNAHLNINHKTLKFNTFSDYMLEARYNLSGNILGIDTVGAGNVFTRLRKATVVHKIKFQEEIKKNQKYWTVTGYDSELNIPEGSIRFESISKENKADTDNFNIILNQNWQLFIGLYQPQAEKILGTVFRNLASSLFERIPVDEIFLK